MAAAKPSISVIARRAAAARPSALLLLPLATVTGRWAALAPLAAGRQHGHHASGCTGGGLFSKLGGHRCHGGGAVACSGGGYAGTCYGGSPYGGGCFGGAGSPGCFGGGVYSVPSGETPRVMPKEVPPVKKTSVAAPGDHCCLPARQCHADRGWQRHDFDLGPAHPGHPSLETDSTYVYTLQVRVNGQTQTQQIQVRGGQTTQAQFSFPQGVASR